MSTCCYIPEKLFIKHAHDLQTALEFTPLMHCLIMAGRPSIHELLASLLENPRFQDMLERTTTSTNNSNIIILQLYHYWLLNLVPSVPPFPTQGPRAGRPWEQDGQLLSPPAPALGQRATTISSSWHVFQNAVDDLHSLFWPGTSSAQQQNTIVPRFHWFGHQHQEGVLTLEFNWGLASPQPLSAPGPKPTNHLFARRWCQPQWPNCTTGSQTSVVVLFELPHNCHVDNIADFLILQYSHDVHIRLLALNAKGILGESCVASIYTPFSVMVWSDHKTMGAHVTFMFTS